jgi:hypothetical protein
VRIRKDLEKLGYEGGETIVDDLFHELRRRFCRRRATSSAPAAAAASWRASTSPSRARRSPSGWGQTRRGYVVTCDLLYSRAFTGALVFSNQPTILLDELARRGAYTVYRIAQGGLRPEIDPQSVPQSSMWFCVPGWLSDRAAPLVS